MADTGVGARLYRLVGERDLNSGASAAIKVARRETIYRLDHDFSTAEQAERPKVVVVPFAIVIIASVPDEQVKNFPYELPHSAQFAVKSGMLSKAFGIRDTTRIVLDARLYHVDHPEWGSRSAVKRYLRSILAHELGSGSPFAPLIEDYRKDPVLTADESQLEGICLLERAICGAVITIEEEADELEFRLFEPNADPDEGNPLRDFGTLLEDELIMFGVDLPKSNFVVPQPVELWMVPEVALRFQRLVEIQQVLAIARERLLESAPAGENLEPVLYFSSHGKRWAEELRLAAYARDVEGEQPYFTYIWEVAHGVETPEEISEMIVRISDELGTKIKAVVELLPEQQCENCGERLFQGPGGFVHDTD